MGSKRWMLANGVGNLLLDQASKHSRFIDLFTGSAAVAHYVSAKLSIPVYAFDLQQFSATLAESVIARRKPLDGEAVWERWQNAAERLLPKKVPVIGNTFTGDTVEELRKWCSDQTRYSIARAYGGHYFSPVQAVWIDVLRQSIPRTQPMRSVALAALIRAASRCAAAPGHTAQPFQPTRGAKKFLREAWERDLPQQTKGALVELCPQHAKRIGNASVADANDAAHALCDRDLVFVDPPYSGVHYSRFYHVLETIAHGTCGPVTGTGRYPDSAKRPRSQYSVQTEAQSAMEDLLETIAERGATAIITYPNGDCSNGLSGGTLQEIAAENFRVVYRMVETRFSTLGGTKLANGRGYGRTARKPTDELVLVLRPK